MKYYSMAFYIKRFYDIDILKFYFPDFKNK
jgi:hypothetical protein